MFIIIRQESLETQFLIEWMKTKLASLASFSLFLTVAIGFQAFVGLYTHARIFEDVREGRETYLDKALVCGFVA